MVEVCFKNMAVEKAIVVVIRRRNRIIKRCTPLNAASNVAPTMQIRTNSMIIDFFIGNPTLAVSDSNYSMEYYTCTQAHDLNDVLLGTVSPILQ